MLSDGIGRDGWNGKRGMRWEERDDMGREGF